MNDMPLTKAQIESLATEIREWLYSYEMWDDVRMYFNGKCWATHDCKTHETKKVDYYYVIKDINPRDYFEYVREPNILSMSFEGNFYDIVNGYYDWQFKMQDEFYDIVSKYGLYYELGNAWNLSLYE